MTITGTLIDELIAAVERAERASRAHEPLDQPPDEPLFAGAFASDPWLVAHENTDYDSKLIGVS
jgi:hypothetical protein